MQDIESAKQHRGSLPRAKNICVAIVMFASVGILLIVSYGIVKVHQSFSRDEFFRAVLMSGKVMEQHGCNPSREFPGTTRKRDEPNDEDADKKIICHVDADKIDTYVGSDDWKMEKEESIKAIEKCDALLDNRCVRKPQYVASQTTSRKCDPICTSFDENANKCGPSFIIIGAQKSATTSLFAFLSKHPSFQAPSRKESHFYHLPVSDNWADSISRKREYLEIFPTCKSCITGEGTPEYSIFPASVVKIKQDWPNARIIMITREPVSRAKSEYNMMRSAKWLAHVQPRFMHLVKMKSFNDEILDDMTRITEAGVVDSVQGTINLNRSSILHPNYYHKFLERGMYASQIEEWLKHYNRDQIMVIRFEDLVDNQKSKCVLRQTLRFLGMQTDSFDNAHMDFWDMPFEMKGGAHPNIPAELESRLKDFYRPFNLRLNQLVGRDFHYTD